MFVPTDENGNVLEEPNRSTHTYQECKQYQTALSKVWFKGFELDFKTSDITSIKKEFCRMWFYSNNIITINSKEITIIEQLIPYNIEITENFGK
jgi:hypothetical protein